MHRDGYNFTDNGAVSKIDLWTDGIHLFDSGKTKIVNDLISSFNYFLGTVIPGNSSHLSEIKDLRLWNLNRVIIGNVNINLRTNLNISKSLL